jgi:hypothetical protein
MEERNYYDQELLLEKLHNYEGRSLQESYDYFMNFKK